MFVRLTDISIKYQKISVVVLVITTKHLYAAKQHIIPSICYCCNSIVVVLGLTVKCHIVNQGG